MSRERKLLPLNFESALYYLQQLLADGNKLAEAVLKHVDFRSGRFYALLNAKAEIGKIHEFRAGGILPQNRLEQVSIHGKQYTGRKKANSVHELASFILEELSLGQWCYFEDLVHLKSDRIITEIQEHVLYHQNQIYLCANKTGLSNSEMEKLIHFSDAQWYYMNLISKEPPGSIPELSEDKIQNIATQATHIVLGAYDMEGFVVWEKSLK